MKTNHQAGRVLRAILAVLTAMPFIWTRSEAAPKPSEASPPPNAKGKELSDLQTPANLIGNWIGTPGDGLVTTMSFSERGEFNLATEKNGGKDFVMKATYKAQATGAGLVVTITDGVEKMHYGMAFLSKDRCAKQTLESPDHKIDWNKRGMILNRVP